MVRNNLFREDLYYRLNVVTIHLPPLRERPEDIPLLAAHFLRIFGKEHNKPDMEMDRELLSFMQSFAWPGNIRQLRNAVENMVVLAGGNRLTIDNLPARLSTEPMRDMQRVQISTNSLVDLERAAVEKALAEFNGHRTRAAESLGISVRTLQRKLKAWGMDRSTVEAAT
jgi:DNA-binding NtrC family response regulator